MPLIERYTQGGNLYPDGASTFAMLVQFFRSLAENRDTRDAALRADWQVAHSTLAVDARAGWQAGDSATLTEAKADATTKAGGAETNARAYTDTKAQDTLGQANAYTDASFAASAPGGAADEAVDAAVDRAILAQRVAPAGIIPANQSRAVGQGELFVNVKHHGVKGDGTTDDTAALQALLNGITAGTVLHFPAGTYRHDRLTVTAKTGFTLSGDRAVLIATTRTSQYLRLVECTDFTIRGITSRGATVTARQGTTRAFSLESCIRFHLDGCAAGPSEGVGIYVGATSRTVTGSTDGRISNCYVAGTKADGIHVTGGSKRVTVTGNSLRDTGDDSIAVVSYLTDLDGCEDVTVSGNVTYHSGSRGLALVGGRGVSLTGNVIDAPKNAGIYVAVESSYGIRAVDTVTINGNTIRAANTYTPPEDTAGVAAYAGIQVVGDSTTYPIRGVSITGNTVSGSKWHALMLGSGGVGMYDLSVVGNTVLDSGARGVFVQSASDVTVVGNTVLRSGEDGVNLTGSRGSLTISSNMVSDANLTSTATARRGILINAPNAATAVITANTVRDDPGKLTAPLDTATTPKVLVFGNSIPGNHAGSSAGLTGMPFVVPTTVLMGGAQPANGSGGGVGVLGMRNATTVPTSNPGLGAVLYVENGALKCRGSNGTVTTIAPA